MAKRKNAPETEEAVVVETVQAAPTGNFFEQNQNYIIYALLGLAAIVGLWYAYKSFIVAPKQKEAVAASWQAQMQFERDSFKLALENPGGGFDGFLGLIDKFGGTPAGNSFKYYAGICCLQTGDFDNAIKHLDDFSPAGDLLPIMKYGALADAYSEKKEFDKAIGNYEKACSQKENELLTAFYLKKLGMLNEYNNNPSAALKAYERLKKDFPQSPDARDIDKFIYRAGGEN